MNLGLSVEIPQKLSENRSEISDKRKWIKKIQVDELLPLRSLAFEH